MNKQYKYTIVVPFAGAKIVDKIKSPHRSMQKALTAYLQEQHPMETGLMIIRGHPKMGWLRDPLS